MKKFQPESLDMLKMSFCLHEVELCILLVPMMAFYLETQSEIDGE